MRPVLALLRCLPCAVLQIDDHASVAGLKLAIQQQLGVPLEQQRLSKDPSLLTAKNGSNIRCARSAVGYPVVM